MYIKIVRRLIYFFIILGIWYFTYKLHLFPENLFPSPFSVLKTLFDNLLNGKIFTIVWNSIYMILMGLSVSFIIVFTLYILSLLSKNINDFVRFIITILDPIPGIAILPIAILWFGIGELSIVIIMIHSIVWPMLLNMLVGVDSIPKIYKEVGKSLGLNQFQMIGDVYLFASLPSILTGVKIGWARAWRALIATEMIVGATGIAGGIGWDIYISRSYLDMTGMLSSIIVLMIIGILIEDVVFNVIEMNTVKKWGF